MSWPTPFADANYTISATVVGQDPYPTQLTVSVTAKTAAGVSILLCNNNIYYVASNGFIDLIAIHD